jgi:hypothetical protein
MLHLQEIVCRPLNVLADFMAVSWTVKECPQNQHVRGALQNGRALSGLFRHGRHSALEQDAMVGLYPTVKH